MSSFHLDIKFSYGWCILSMSYQQQSIDIRNHWLNDGFSEFVDSVRLLLDGKNSVSIRWQHEVAGGCFVDLVADPKGGIGVAVHDFYHGAEANTADTIWSAVRGSLRFKAHVPMKEFVNEFTAALRRVRALSVDSTGFIEHWQYTFPQAEYETIERKSVKKFGYKPKRRQEIVDK